MTTDQDEAARRIMDQFGEASRIPYLNIEEGDIGVIVGLPIVGLFFASFSGLNSLALPLMTGGLGIGVAIVFMTPSHLNAWTWITDVYRYLKRPTHTFAAPADPDSETNETERSRGGLANYTPFKPDERTQDLTNVKRAWPGAGAIQRADGTMEAFIEIDPGNMDFAMASDWAKLHETGEGFANKELDSKIKLHTTTRSFPVDRITENIEARLNDEDVAANPALQELLEEYREKRPQEMRDRGIQQHRYYLGVQARPLEVYNRSKDEGTPAEKLTDFPVIGFLFTPFVTRREDLSEAERRAKMFEKLDTRVNEVRSEFIQQASGWSARRLSTVELFMLNMDFWNGHEHEYDEAGLAVRNQPIVGQSQRRTDTDE
ncbi:hypothetical protein ACFQAS_15460 [Halopenitus salinus]|uniref:PrgI family protein n=1 Tax=Halopenitus salinus TaxID=1198295 RepID=A0ABD5V1I7_9EURY